MNRGLLVLSSVVLTTALADAYAQDKKADTASSLGMKLVLIPAGEFQMGSSPEEIKHWNDWYQQQDPKKPIDINREGPRHRVRITKPFYLGKYHVTRGEFRKFVGETNYRTDAGEGRARRSWVYRGRRMGTEGGVHLAERGL